MFSCKQSKYEHRKNVKCHPPIHKPESVQEENERLKKDIKQIKIQIEIKDVTIDKLQNQVEIKDTEIEHLIELAFEDEKLQKKPEQKQKPKRGFVTQVIRTQVAASQKWCCRICTELLTGIFHIDHTLPLSFGGEDKLENVTALCVQCHAVKTQNEWKLR